MKAVQQQLHRVVWLDCFESQILNINIQITRLSAEIRNKFTPFVQTDFILVQMIKRDINEAELSLAQGYSYRALSEEQLHY